MKLPTEVKIGSVVYTIKEVKEIYEKGKLKSNYLGFFDCENSQILVLESLHQDKKFLTVMHEIFHGIENNYGLSLKEEEADALALSIIMLFKDNPQLKKFL